MPKQKAKAAVKSRTLLVFIGLIACFPGLAHSQTLIFAADEWCPVNCAPNSENPGYMVEIAKAILEPLGYKVVYQQINWARALIHTRSGEFDGVFAGTPHEAIDFIFPEEPQGQYKIGLFVRKEATWTYTVPESLSGKSAGLIIDYSYGKDIDQQLKQYTTPVYTGGDAPLEQNIKILAAGRFDLIVEDINTFRHKAAELGLANRFRLEETFTVDNLYIALSPAKASSHKIAQALTVGMRRLRQSGELGRILQKYGLSDWVSPEPAGAKTVQSD